MDNLNGNDTSNSVEETANQRDAKKRTSYVARDHKSMVEFVAEVYKNLGHTEYHSNKAIATVHQLSPDSIKQHLTSSQQYKLLEIKYGVGYKVTELFKRIYLPINDAEKRSAVIESLKFPDTYQQLFKEYEFNIVPPVNGIKNHFVRNFQYKDDIAERAAQVFIENLKEYELLDSRGVLTSGMPLKPVFAEVKSETQDDGQAANKNDEVNNSSSFNDLPAIQQPQKVIFQTELETQGKKTVPIYLTDEKQALFVYPNDITADDIDLVKHQIEGILLRIKLESKKKKEE